MTTQTQPQAQPQSDYFDLHTTGVGYLNRVRVIQPSGGKKGSSYLACSIAALHGSKDDVQYTHYELIVVGEDAIKHINALQTAANDRHVKVLIGFKLGDSTPVTFIYGAHHANAGEQGINIRARLLQVSFAKVDGEYRVAPSTTKNQEAQAAQSTTQPETQVSTPDHEVHEAEAAVV